MAIAYWVAIYGATLVPQLVKNYYVILSHDNTHCTYLDICN